MRRWVILGALFAGLGVAIGAFGAHGLRAVLEANQRADTFGTATQYHQLHALALFIVAWLTTHTNNRRVQWAGWLFVVGILLFAGSLYVLAITNAGFFGAIAPIGGAAFIAGWACIGWAAWEN